MSLTSALPQYFVSVQRFLRAICSHSPIGDFHERGGVFPSSAASVSSPSFKLLDFEKKKIYNLKVEASNPHVEPRFFYLGPFKDSATVRIMVEDVDEPPVFSKLAYILQIREDAQINTTLGSVSAQDPDAARNPVK